MLHLAAGVALVAGRRSARSWRGRLRRRLAMREARDSSARRARHRARFMAIGGLALCAWFALVIIATEIPVLVLHPCTP